MTRCNINLLFGLFSLLFISSTILPFTASQTSSGSIVFTLEEELKADTLIGNVAEASGVESEVSPEEFQGLRYQILSSDGLKISSLFTINSQTGALFTNAMIDREQVCDSTVTTCKLVFDVTVKSGVVVIKLLNIEVVIKDKNDNPPEFATKVERKSISEATPKNESISISSAIDKDSNQNTELTYWMDQSDVFKLREEKLLDITRLNLVLMQNLDRETENEYRLRIYAKDGNTSSALTGTMSVIITVTDVNDNRPKFTENEYNFTVKEDAEKGSFVGAIAATDLDAGENGRVSYSFSFMTSARVLNLFTLDPDSGNITVKSELQYESSSKFQAVIDAKDHGESPKSAQVILEINVIDAGNTPPKLSLTLQDALYQDSIRLNEDVPSESFVGTLKYQDNDDGDNGVVDCVSMNSHFALAYLEDGYAIEVKNQLDRETESEIRVVLKCSDRGTPSLSSFANFTVMVFDVNDNSPVFQRSDYTGTVTERVSAKENLVQVSAKDADEGKNKEVTYQLTANSSNSFSIDPFTGWITLISPVDREAGPVIYLTVEAVDKGATPQTGSTTVTIIVEDVNDNTPEIIRVEYQVRENQEPGAFVAQIVGADSDDGINGELTYELVSDPSRSFRVSESGIISTATKFDRETVAHYFITVSVKDKGSPPLSSTSTLTISITDTNDHSPQIVYPAPGNDSVIVSANLSPGSVIVRASATDKDLDKNAKLKYIIAEGNPHKIFSIDNSTGTIFVSKRLTTSRESSYRLTISVQDSGNPRLHNNTYLYIKIDFTNATLVDDASAMEQKYIIIAGIIAGITVVIAVIVIAIIIKLRRTDPSRCNESSNKPHAEKSHDAGPKFIAEHNLHAVPAYTFEPSDNEAGFKDDKNKSREQNTSFDSHMTSGSLAFNQKAGLTQDLLDRHSNPSFSLFPEGRQRLVSEDIHSDTSGDATTSDSGRGASDAEDAPTASPPMPYHAGAKPMKPGAPRVPPRHPVAGTVLPLSQQHVGPVYSRDSSSLGDLSRAARAHAPHKDMDKSHKQPSKVRFSLDDHSVYDPRLNSSQAYSDSQPLSRSLRVTSGNNNLNFPGNAGRFAVNRNQNIPGPKDHLNVMQLQPRDQLGSHSSNTSNTIPLSRDAVAKHDRIHGRPKQQQKLLPSNIYSHRHPYHPNHMPLSQLSHSIDENEDDGGSTTTSGSYAIDDMDDTLNVSVEC